MQGHAHIRDARSQRPSGYMGHSASFRLQRSACRTCITYFTGNRSSSRAHPARIALAPQARYISRVMIHLKPITWRGRSWQFEAFKKLRRTILPYQDFAGFQ
jgi:hypothetical protein